ncbi:MAG: hypothetical protein V2B13_03295 [Pseudomonadota bacterium]
MRRTSKYASLLLVLFRILGMLGRHPFRMVPGLRASQPVGRSTLSN